MPVGSHHHRGGVHPPAGSPRTRGGRNAQGGGRKEETAVRLTVLLAAMLPRSAPPLEAVRDNPTVHT